MIVKREGGQTAAYGEFAALYDALMHGVDYDGWASWLVERLRAGGVDPRPTGGGKPPLVLDCACGTGALTVRLSRLGYDVVGSDLSEDMLRAAQQKAMAAGLRIPFVRQDMRHVCAHRPADAVTACCDGVNYLTSADDVCAFFRAAYAALRPGGLLLFDVSSAYKLSAVLGGNTFGEDTPDCTYLWRNAFDPATRLLEMRLAFFTPDGGGRYRRFDETHLQRAHTAAEISAWLTACGFVGQACYAAFTADAPKEDTERIQWTAYKPQTQTATR